MSPPAVQRRRWSRRGYDRVVDSGVFRPEDRLELLDGEIWEMTPQSSRHAIAETSLAHDRGRKLAAYARNGVPEYWLLDLTAERLEVYRAPRGAAYESRTVLAAGDRVRPLHAPEASLGVADLLP